MKVLVKKSDSKVVQKENILVEQMRDKKGGQIAEMFCKVGEKEFALAIA
jgi:hypothetical protein